MRPERAQYASVQAQNLAIKLLQDTRECHAPCRTRLKYVHDVSWTRANVTLELSCTVAEQPTG